MDAGLLDSPADRERSEAFSAVAAKAGKPVRALINNVAYPVQRLHVVLERRPVEQADLRHIRRTQTRLAALPLDRLDHRGFFAANVRASAAAEVDGRDRIRRIRPKRCEFPLENGAAAVVLVAQVYIDVGDAHRPRGDECALEEAMRVALEVKTILERDWLAFVDVDGHQPRLRLRRHDLPFASSREPGAAEAAQAGRLHRRDDVCAPPPTSVTRRRQLVAACGAITRIVD